jgi:electron transport complex protein RnfE
MTATTDRPRSVTRALWRENWPLVQLLGITPALVATTSVVKGLALGVLTALVLLAANGVTAALGFLLLPGARVALHLLVAVTAVTCLDWFVHATFYELHGALGVYLSLIVANGGLLMEARSFSRGRAPGEALAGALFAGIGFTAVLVALGALRELVGQGTLFADLALLGGDGESWLSVRLPFAGAQIALAPPGALLGLGLLLALRNRRAHEATGQDDEPR